MSVSNFIRVRKDDPCPICGKPDWCMIARDRSVAMCARVQAGSFSKTKGGWCHRLTVRPASVVNFERNRGNRRSSPPATQWSSFDKPAASLTSLIESLSCSFGVKPSGNWLYQDVDGSEVMRVLRFDPRGQSKQYRPIHFDGTGWRVGDPPERLLPLYRLPELFGDQDKETRGHGDKGKDGDEASPLVSPSPCPLVFVTEGEKCADAAASLGLLATTSAHGSASADKTDWSPLAGRTVIILPDNDSAGMSYARDVARLLLQQSPQPVVKIVELPDLPPKGDLVDWLEQRDSTEPRDLRNQLEALALAVRALDPSEVIGGAELVSLSSVQGREVHWLWPNRIARGKLTLLVGDPGVGKSFLTLDLAARISTGSPWPDESLPFPSPGTPGEGQGEGSFSSNETEPSPQPSPGVPGEGAGGPGHVILISAEDDLHDTVHPRLQRAGADMSRITWLQSVRQLTLGGKTESRAFTLEDVSALRDALQRIPDTCLVVIDPVSAYLGDKCDGNNNAQVRGMLAQLNTLASEFDCAMVLVTHLNKAKDTGATRSRALYRAMGSLAFVAAARCAMLACKDSRDPTRRLLLPMKNNIGNDTDGLAWRIIEGMVAWEAAPVELSSDEAMGLAAIPLSGENPVTTITEWLRERLKANPIPAADVKREAIAKGFSLSTLERARLALGVTTTKSAGSFTSPWVWSLPQQMPLSA